MKVFGPDGFVVCGLGYPALPGKVRVGVPQTFASLTTTVNVTADESVPLEWVIAAGDAVALVIWQTAGSRTVNVMS